MLVRRELPDDAAGVSDVHAVAFPAPPDGGPPGEVRLVDQLRSCGAWIPELSWVAVDAGRIVGHVVCTRAHVDDVAVVGLGPLGVVPALQRGGIGLALVHSVLAAADALGEPLVGLLGSPEYYGRFGFVRSTDMGVEPPDPAWGPHFQVRTLHAHTPALTGTFRYAAPFDGV